MSPCCPRPCHRLRVRAFWSRIGVVPLDCSVRSPFRRCGLLLLPLALLVAVGPALAAPATEAEVELYTRIAALNVCISRSAGIDYNKAVAVSSETIAQLIQGQHGGVIAKVGSTPLTIDALRQGSINAAVLASVQVCPKEVPDDVKAKVEAALKNGSVAAPTARPAASPAARPATQPTGRPAATTPATRPAARP